MDIKNDNIKKYTLDEVVDVLISMEKRITSLEKRLLDSTVSIHNLFENTNERLSQLEDSKYGCF